VNLPSNVEATAPLIEATPKAIHVHQISTFRRLLRDRSGIESLEVRSIEPPPFARRGACDRRPAEVRVSMGKSFEKRNSTVSYLKGQALTAAGVGRGDAFWSSAERFRSSEARFGRQKSVYRSSYEARGTF
jgi:hypothetical protein